MIEQHFITLSGGLSGASASATNCGPSAEPPIPTESIWVNRPSGDDGGLIYQTKTTKNQQIHTHTKTKQIQYNVFCFATVKIDFTK